MDKSDEYLSLSLDAITSYIRGNINLDEATDILTTLGHSLKSARKVLKETERNNIIKLTPKKKQKTKNNKTKNQNNIIEMNQKKLNKLKGLNDPDGDFYIDMEIEDFIALNENEDEYYFEIDYES